MSHTSRSGSKKPMTFEYCASCGGDLDTGWECNRCQRDWRPWAYPWWERLRDRMVKVFR
jgi:hypothetical protein